MQIKKIRVEIEPKEELHGLISQLSIYVEDEIASTRKIVGNMNLDWDPRAMLRSNLETMGRELEEVIFGKE